MATLGQNCNRAANFLSSYLTLSLSRALTHFMRKIYLLALSAACINSACTSLNTQLPEIAPSALAAEQAAQEKSAFGEMGALRGRLNEVAHKVLLANQDMCQKTSLDIGVKTQTLKGYPKNLRAGAKRELGLGDKPMITYVRSGSPGAQAGLKIGDILLGEDGGIIGAPSKALRHHLQNNLQLQKSRQKIQSAIDLVPETVCDYRVYLKMSPSINAFATGKSIIVTAGMMNFVTSDDELAYIIGHELAHNTQSHIRKSITNYVLSLGGTRYTRPFEAEADYVGLYYMTRAGFDSSGVEDIWRRLSQQSLRPIARAKTHPAYPSRTLQIAAARDEISRKRSTGEALLPEPRK